MPFASDAGPPRRPPNVARKNRRTTRLTRHRIPVVLVRVPPATEMPRLQGDYDAWRLPAGPFDISPLASINGPSIRSFTSSMSPFEDPSPFATM